MTQQTTVTAGQPRRVTILGSTGSIGCNTVDLIERDRERFAVEALTANGSVEMLAEQAIRLGAKMAVVADETKYAALKRALGASGVRAGAGPQALIEAASLPADWVMAAIVGAAGLEPTLAAARRGAIVALANKECLVCAGDLFLREVSSHGARLLPVDSEHNAIYQVLDHEHRDRVERIILTASGGPFLDVERDAMAGVTPQQAVAHPNWSMGAKISVDSATMMNKGLELIEAHYLFEMPDDRIDILVHPQSIIHSMVSYVDGSVLAQLGSPDMRTPIAYTLAWPDRMPTPAQRLDLARIGQLTFRAPDPVRFPAIRLAREALRAGGVAPTILNAANEVAVHAFLDRQIGFLDIPRLVEHTLEFVPNLAMNSLEDVIAIDRQARAVARAGMVRAAVNA
ncbi:MAG: 1-deoxy-D-xylulose-5-phosphate reductoisomerase [Rhodospirillales bacterium]